MPICIMISFESITITIKSPVTKCELRIGQDLNLSNNIFLVSKRIQKSKKFIPIIKINI